MKNSTQLLTALAIAGAFFVNTAKAQTATTSTTSTSMAAPNPWRFGIGLEAGVPTGDLHSLSSFELGGTARLQYRVTKDFDFMLTSGYYNDFAKSNTSALTTIGNTTYATTAHHQGMIPVKLGIKDFFTKSIYFSAEAGAGFETEYSTNTKLILAPGLGWANKTVDIGVRYENFSGQNQNYGLIGLRIAYGFRL